MLELGGGGGKEERKQRTVTHNLDSDDKGIGLLTCCLTVRSDSVQPTQQKRGTSIGVIGTTFTGRDENQFLFRQPIEQLGLIWINNAEWSKICSLWFSLDFPCFHWASSEIIRVLGGPSVGAV